MPRATKTRRAGNGAARLADGADLASIVRPQDGLISRRIFADPEIYNLEVERIFGHGWFYLGHDSEIPKPGDVVTRPCGIDPAILIRGDDGVVRAFLNSCRHRGMRVCRTDHENARALRCPYHGWSYRNTGELIAASSEHHYGAGELEKDQLGLIPVAQLGNFRGLYFATWDRDAPPLEEWLGDMRFYMEIIFARTGEIEVGVPQIWDVDCAWTFATDNFTDNFHVYYAHKSLVEVGLLPNFPDFAAHGHMVTIPNGHILHFVQGAPGDESSMGLGLPKSMWPQFERHLQPAQAEIAKNHGYSAGTMWPNFHWLQLTVTGDTATPPVGVLNLRLEVPLSPTRTRMYSWFAIDKSAPADYRRTSYEQFVRTFGPGGIFDQDDMENWEECTAAAIGPAAKRHTLHHKMGLNRPRATDWPGPGTAYPDSYGEMTQRAWYAEWLRVMTTQAGGTAAR